MQIIPAKALLKNDGIPASKNGSNPTSLTKNPEMNNINPSPTMPMPI
jgi:hypothetical protein